MYPKRTYAKAFTSRYPILGNFSWLLNVHAYHVLISGLSQQPTKRHVWCQRREEEENSWGDTLYMKGIFKITCIVWNFTFDVRN